MGASLFQFRSRGLGKAGNNISFSGARGLGKQEIPFPFPVRVAWGSGKYHFRFQCTCREGRKGPKATPFCSRFRCRWQEVVQGTYSLVEGRVWMGAYACAAPTANNLSSTNLAGTEKFCACSD